MTIYTRIYNYYGKDDDDDDDDDDNDEDVSLNHVVLQSLRNYQLCTFINYNYLKTKSVIIIVLCSAKNHNPN